MRVYDLRVGVEGFGLRVYNSGFMVGCGAVANPLAFRAQFLGTRFEVEG